jgi:hypothetical protein
MDRESREVIFEMVTLTIISLLVGTFLAQRFKVLVLAPVILLFTVILAFGAGIARADAGWTVGLTATMTIVGLQIGYLLGIGIRHLIVVAPRKSFARGFAWGLVPRVNEYPAAALALDVGQAARRNDLGFAPDLISCSISMR